MLGSHRSGFDGERMHLAVLSILLLVLLGACEDQVAAPSRMEEPFSMYGIINPRLFFQTVGIAPIQPLLHDYPASLDAVVTSTDLQTDETITWRDSVVTGDRGQLDHVFYAEFLPEFGRTYRVEAVRSDGAATSAIARVPELVEVSAETDTEQRLQILITGERFNLLSIEVIYQLRLHAFADPDPCSTEPFTHTVDYTGTESEIEHGFGFRVRLPLDRNDIESAYVRRPSEYGVALMRMDVRLVVGDEDWDPPGGDFDPNTLSDPDVMTNTTNGFGLVAGGYNHDAVAFPPVSAIAATRFYDYVVRPPADCYDYCGCGQ